MRWLQPQVTKKQVDKFEQGKLTPCCQLLAAKAPGRKENVQYQVNLKGAKYPNDLFVINLPAGGILYYSYENLTMHA